jgi:2,3-dihydroxyphenylpropionate 1,2-dioxygenase
MKNMLICASHSPLMLVNMPPSTESSQEFFKHLSEAKKRIKIFDPELIVIFGPDHFNGFFFDLMPSFCIGIQAETTQDWNLQKEKLNVPSEISMGCINFVRKMDVDVAFSWNMKADHGISIALHQLTESLTSYPVIPIFMNCAAHPRPSFKRSRIFGNAVGQYLATLNKRTLIIASGGVSHDPPTPRFEFSPLNLRQRLVDRHVASTEELKKREQNVINAANLLVKGEGPCLPPNPEWDHQFINNLIDFNTHELDNISDEEIDEKVGFGGHEVRTWVSAVSAMRAIEPCTIKLDYYDVVPEWITGMGMISSI